MLPIPRGETQNAHAGSRTRVTSMGGLYDAATLRAPLHASATCAYSCACRTTHYSWDASLPGDRVDRGPVVLLRALLTLWRSPRKRLQTETYTERATKQIYDNNHVVPQCSVSRRCGMPSSIAAALHACVRNNTTPGCAPAVFWSCGGHERPARRRSDSCGVRTHALTAWRLKPAP